MNNDIALYWFRQDLRLADNPALVAAARHQKILPIYILDTHNAGAYERGSASKYWLHHSLEKLQQSLGGNLSIYAGNPLDILQELSARYHIKHIYWNRCYEPWRIQRDTRIKAELGAQNITIHSFNGSLLREPWEVLKDDGSSYQVFTPLYKKHYAQYYARTPLPTPISAHYCVDTLHSLNINDLNLLPMHTWHTTLEKHWNIGEVAAMQRLTTFINKNLNSYKKGRDFLTQSSVSRLSPYLHFGEISPHQVAYAIANAANDENTEHFHRELSWREFSYSQLYYNPELPTKNLKSSFDNFPWNDDETTLRAWQQGRTGIPLIDAGMRELWQTGYMHNRVRMLVGSFLVKNLLIDWRYGERWFWDTLVDADLANNSASWQWVAGCGADAAPYFRIFNPVTQGQKFDSSGEYLRRFVPELAQLPNAYLFNPWEAPTQILRDANIVLGEDYPHPIVDLKFSRTRALEALQLSKNS